MPIQPLDKKLEAFTDTIISEAIADANAITLELQNKQAALIARAEKKIAAEAESYQKAAIEEIRAEQESRISAKLGENKFTLLEFREACTRRIYAQVEKKIQEFTASEAYLPHLEKLLKRAIEKLGSQTAAEVYLRPEDMPFQQALIRALPGTALSFFEDECSLGGLLVVSPEKAMRADMRFDTALLDMVGHVSELAGLKMGQ